VTAGIACPGPCNNRYRRLTAMHEAALRLYDAKAELADGEDIGDPPQRPALQPSWGDPVWCPTCQGRLSQELSEVDDLASSLAVLPPGIRPATNNRPDPVKVSGTRGEPSPSPSADTLDELAGWLRAWEAVAKRSDHRPRRGELSTEITAITGWLGAHLAAILRITEVDDGLGQPYAEAFGLQLTGWHRRLVRDTHSGSEPKHFKQPCPGCAKYTLWDYPGETYLRCVNQECQARPTREDASPAT
jgi:hypothetical protein